MTPRELHDREAAARLVESWGYPRRVWESEIRNGSWFTDEPQTGIIWLEHGRDPGDLVLHGCAVPKLGRPAITALSMHTIRCVAGLLGARRLYAPVPADLPDSRKLLRYLRMHGWTATDDPLPGVYLEIGG